MTEQNLSALAIRAFREVQIEMGMDPTVGQVLFPGLSETLEQISSLPADALLFGIAADGMPLLLQLRDPRPGSVLVLGEKGSGKTEFLQVMLRSAQRLSAPSETQFAVLTAHPADFDDFVPNNRFLGVWPSYSDDATEMLYQLAWRVQNPVPTQPVVLMLDGLECILQMDQAAQENLAYILAFGPQSLVWPVVSLNSEMALKLSGWLSYFETRIFGRISNPRTAAALAPQGAALDGLFPGSQFYLKRNSGWLKFWLPNL